MTTLEQADNGPIYNEAKALTPLEAMLRQVFLETVIAKLVAIWSHTIMNFEEKNCYRSQAIIKRKKIIQS